ncbi:hypothetical protein PRIPAC_93218 [Pristionchus pacificus]|uniref:Uncharacterized protein n=1 Tax=Pristionchus pacificus TaxID=54126 RepID=A0A2A6BR27_PRIPA|nr:hypothetical protein PRIPAC_93218 [Pristionchus pacificus]|eukprot:PDM68369.1 hypothetical protein PRIPAC_46413 [Pristionchus pacificus]
MRPFLSALILFPLLVTSKVADDQSEGKIDQVKQDKKASHSPKDAHIDQAKIYVSMFEQKRRDHMSAVDSIVGIDEMKQRPFIEEIVKNIKNILIESRETLDRVRYSPVKGVLPETETVRDSLSKVFENTAFLSDIALRFPSIIRPRIKDVKMKTVLVWSVETTKKADLIDETTQKVIHLMEQEMELVPKKEGFINPYGNEKSKEEKMREAVEEMKKKADEKKNKKHDLKIKKGPSMSKSEL